MTFVLGLTGSIGTGKSTIANIFREKGIIVLDADEIVHRIQGKGQLGLNMMVAEFGQEILNFDETLNREKLKTMVFFNENEKELTRLSKVLDPIIKKIFEDELAKLKKKKVSLVVLDIPLLYEKHYEKMVDEVMLSFIPKTLEIERLIKRDQLKTDVAEQLLKSQWPIARKKKLADTVIDNSGSLANTREQVENWLREKVQIAAQKQNYFARGERDMDIGLLERFQKYLPVTERTPKFSLGEGNTPLIFLPHLSKKLQLKLYGKCEGLNPTGSFKDRGMVLAVAKAVEEKATAICCASTGNTSASAAAYAATAGVKAYVVIPDGKIALGKLAQAIMYGAEIIAIPGNFDEALRSVREISATENLTLVNSVNPYRLEGQKTAAFEICEQLKKAPHVIAIPVGNAGNISAYWKGFKEWQQVNGTTLPRMHGFEAEGAAAIVKGVSIEQPETIATAIRIGNPASWKLAENARDESDGFIDFVTDAEIIEAYQKVAKMDGVFIEPASAASLAGVIKHLKAGKIKTGETVVCVFTGNGLKDPDTAIDKSKIVIQKMSAIEEMRLYLRKKVSK